MKKEKPAEKADENVGTPDDCDDRNESIGIVNRKKVEPVCGDEKNSYSENNRAKLKPDLGGTSFFRKMLPENKNPLERRHVDVVVELDG